MGRPRTTHRDMPPGFRLVAGRWHWRPTNAAGRRVLEQLAPGKQGLAAGPDNADKTAARRWWVDTVLPRLDAVAAEQRADAERPTEAPHTVAALIEAYRHAGMHKADGTPLRDRTRADYESHLDALKAAFGSRPYARSEHEAAVSPSKPAPLRRTDVRQWVLAAAGSEPGKPRAPKLANRRAAVLSSVFRHAIDCGITEYNPCAGVRRNPEPKRQRYLGTDELARLIEHPSAEGSVRDLIDWIYQTLQRYEDILTFGPHLIRTLDDGRRILRVQPSKTRDTTAQTVDIEITPAIAALIARGQLTDDQRRRRGTPIRWTWIHTRHGAPYKPEGIASLFERVRDAAGLKDIGLKDVRGKAATDMLAAGTPITVIQQLLGHASVTTTEIYIKRYSTAAVTPNSSVAARVEQFRERAKG